MIYRKLFTILRRPVLIAILLLAGSCGKTTDGSKAIVVTSLLGKSYYEPTRPANVQSKLDSSLAVAKANLEADPSEENYIWYGRRLGYLSRFQEAIDAFSAGIDQYPTSARLYRHRGHRYISFRLFDSAINDLIKANSLIPSLPLEVEPDGTPNKINTPLSSTQFNIRYHLAMAFYLKGDFQNAEQVYFQCLKTCNNDDLLVACIDWMYMTYRRQGKLDFANSVLGNVRDSMNIVENDSYYRRCRMYQGHLSPDSVIRASSGQGDAELALATQGYGVGNWYLYNGDSARAKDVFEKIIASGYFGAFGFIGAEAELARWPKE